VGKHFYGKSFPILNVNEEGLAHLKTGLYAQIKSTKSGSYIRISSGMVVAWIKRSPPAIYISPPTGKHTLGWRFEAVFSLLQTSIVAIL